MANFSTGDLTMIKKFYCVMFAIVLLSVSTRPVAAQGGLFFADGLTHTITGPAPDVIIAGFGTTLNVGPGANILGRDATGPNTAKPGISAGGVGTSIHMTGGTVTAGNETSPFSFGGNPGITTSAALFISGGTVNAGQSPTVGSGSTGIAIDAIGPVTISGGTFNASGAGYALRFQGSQAAGLNISGGTFNGGINIFDTNMDLSLISGGMFNGIMNQIVNGAASSTVITGGFFGGNNTAFGGTDLGSTSIMGGSFQGNFSLTLTNNATLSINGSNLIYSGGRLTGTLADGEAISVGIVQSDPRYAFHVTNSTPNQVIFTGDVLVSPPPTPEPTSLMMVGTGLACISATAWRRRRKTRGTARSETRPSYAPTLT
jgi:hypothetical protein